ncbi:hypothetical protein B0H14DRAFT_2613955 [Mycena olivaceomarginata]|nr:hypothetical protein B0H14DRAFT_2613955 [Mycena olivaceomarginata]
MPDETVNRLVFLPALDQGDVRRCRRDVKEAEHVHAQKAGAMISDGHRLWERKKLTESPTRPQSGLKVEWAGRKCQVKYWTGLMANLLSLGHDEGVTWGRLGSSPSDHGEGDLIYRLGPLVTCFGDPAKRKDDIPEWYLEKVDESSESEDGDGEENELGLIGRESKIIHLQLGDLGMIFWDFSRISDEVHTLHLAGPPKHATSRPTVQIWRFGYPGEDSLVFTAGV